MQTSATLSAQIQANLNQLQNWSQYTREQVYDMITRSVEHYFASTPAAVVAPTVAVGGGKKVAATPDQWSRILNSKEYGVCAYPEFKAEHEEMKKARPGLNYFTAVSEIRTKYEGTPHWQGYLAWVRAKHPHPDAVAKDPSPRKTIGGVATAAAPAPVMSTAGGVAVPQLPVPTAVPAVPQAVPMVPQAAVPTVPPAATVPAAAPMAVPTATA